MNRSATVNIVTSSNIFFSFFGYDFFGHGFFSCENLKSVMNVTMP